MTENQMGRALSQISDISGTVALNNGVEMPYLGLGVMNVEGLVDAIGWAVEAGYRLFDTASIYGNEAEVGEGIRASGIPREDVFVTSKVWNTDQGYESALSALERSLDRLGFEYLDLYLIHWPVAGKYKQTWKALEKLYADGRVRAIGVSNFLRPHLEELLSDAEIRPTVDQLEFHPRLAQQPLLDFCIESGIQYQAWSPLMAGRVVEVEEIRELAERYERTEAQIVLRWSLQKGVATIPKTSHRRRIIENADVFDFELADQDMMLIDSLDEGIRIGPDPDDFDFGDRRPPD